MNERILGELLSGRREELGRSRAEQARRVGVSEATLQRWEATGVMSTSHAFVLAEDLGLSWELIYPVNSDLQMSVLGLYAADFSTEDDYQQALAWALRSAHYAAAMTRADASFDYNGLEGLL